MAKGEARAELREQVAENHRRFVACPEGGEHDWAGGEGNPCRKCGVGGRENFNAATRARAGLFRRLKAPASAHGQVKTK